MIQTLTASHEEALGLGPLAPLPNGQEPCSTGPPNPPAALHKAEDREQHVAEADGERAGGAWVGKGATPGAFGAKIPRNETDV